VWCDSMHAVEPREVRANARMMNVEAIADGLSALAGSGWVTISGGNPALHNLSELITTLQRRGFVVTLETQGSIFKPWMALLDALTVSPKPPSSKMPAIADELLRTFATIEGPDVSFKVVVFDEQDYDYAKSVLTSHRVAGYLSVGTLYSDSMESLVNRYRWLAEKTANDPEMKYVKVLPQLHVILWGHSKGV